MMKTHLYICLAVTLFLGTACSAEPAPSSPDLSDSISESDTAQTSGDTPQKTGDTAQKTGDTGRTSGDSGPADSLPVDTAPPPPPCVGDAECDDGVNCTVDSCEPTGCVSTPDVALCDDGDVCTDDSCDPADGCLHVTPEPGCDDGIPCTTDTCDAITGCAHAPDHALCDDGVDCTEDACLLDSGCQSTPQNGVCDDDEPCTDDGCEPVEGCTFTPNQMPCDDGDKCTANDTCSAGICAGAADGSCIYTVDPVLDDCFEGVLSQWHKDAALNQVNFIRALSNLPPVVYAPEGDVEAQRSSLIMLSNGNLSHTPPENWLCWSQEGYDGAESSNLHITWKWDSTFETSASSVNGFLIDNKVESLGHRRWILDPFLKQVSYGAIHGKILAGGNYPYGFTSTLKVIWGVQANIENIDATYAAYPHGDYPTELMKNDWYLSFSALVDKKSKWNNKDVDFSKVNISVKKKSNGQSLNVHSIQVSNQGFGIPNHVQWKVDNLADNVTYTVSLTGIIYQGQPKSYSYEFTLVE